MVTNMLRAISEMLNTKPTDNAQEAMARVKCAKIMLDEIIKGMSIPQTETISTTSTQVTVQPASKEKTSPLATVLEKKEPEYTMEIDPVTKVLKWMKRDGKFLGASELLLIDGNQFPYSKAIGMSFKKISVVSDAE